VKVLVRFWIYFLRLPWRVNLADGATRCESSTISQPSARSKSILGVECSHPIANLQDRLRAWRKTGASPLALCRSTSPRTTRAC